MKKLILAFFLLTTGAAFAQQADEQPAQGTPRPQQTPEQRATSMSERMTKGLGITDEQKTKVYNLALIKAQKSDELRASSTGDKALDRSKMKTINDAFDANLKDILTPDQYTKWQEQRSKQGQRPPQGR